MNKTHSTSKKNPNKLWKKKKQITKYDIYLKKNLKRHLMVIAIGKPAVYMSLSKYILLMRCLLYEAYIFFYLAPLNKIKEEPCIELYKNLNILGTQLDHDLATSLEENEKMRKKIRKKIIHSICMLLGLERKSPIENTFQHYFWRWWKAQPILFDFSPTWTSDGIISSTKG